MKHKTVGLPVYHCRKIDSDIKLSGKIDDPKWKLAENIRLVDTIKGETADQLTEVRILYSDTTLYIAFYCEDDYIWGTYKKSDSPIYDEECVEVFLNPGCSDHQYYELNVSPKNTVFTACILSNRLKERADEGFIGLTDFNPEIVTKVNVEGELGIPGKGRFWCVEYAIPFNEFYGAPHIIPSPGDQWRMNLYRIDSPQKGSSRYYAWSPTSRIEFHLPWRFGMLKFE